MLTLKKVKELAEAPSHAKRTPSPKMLFEEGIVLLRREFDQGSHLTVYNSGYVLFSAGKRNTVFHKLVQQAISDMEKLMAARQQSKEQERSSTKKSVLDALRSLKAKKQEQPAQEQDKPKKAKTKGMEL